MFCKKSFGGLVLAFVGFGSSFLCASDLNMELDCKTYFKRLSDLGIVQKDAKKIKKARKVSERLFSSLRKSSSSEATLKSFIKKSSVLSKRFRPNDRITTENLRRSILDMSSSELKALAKEIDAFNFDSNASQN